MTEVRLMHCLAALDAPTSGEAIVDGTALSGLKDKALTTLRRKRVGFVFQAFNLIPTLSARENILLPLDLAGRKPDQEWFDAVIDAVGLRPSAGDSSRHRGPGGSPAVEAGDPDQRQLSGDHIRPGCPWGDDGDLIAHGVPGAFGGPSVQRDLVRRLHARRL